MSSGLTGGAFGHGQNAEVVSEAVEIGYTVERQLVDGDIVLFNRQPSCIGCR